MHVYVISRGFTGIHDFVINQQDKHECNISKIRKTTLLYLCGIITKYVLILFLFYEIIYQKYHKITVSYFNLKSKPY